MVSKFYITYEDMYKIILPKKRKDNTDSIDLAKRLQNDLINSEEALKERLEKFDISYVKPDSINLFDMEKHFLRSVMYKNWFYKSDLYGKVKLKSEKCCYCITGPVQHLDHFFNKNDNPELSISTINLVPSCSTCNERKLQDAVYVHPYYENIHEYEWLKCTIKWDERPVVVFSISHPISMPLDMYKRLKYQLSFTNFLSIINEKAVGDLGSNLGGWKLLLDKGVPESVFLGMIEDFRKERKKNFGCDSWQFVLYDYLFRNISQLIYKLKN